MKHVHTFVTHPVAGAIYHGVHDGTCLLILSVTQDMRGDGPAPVALVADLQAGRLRLMDVHAFAGSRQRFIRMQD